MDIEFHYYMTYLIAARAGYTPEEAVIIAYSSQYVDDNERIFSVGPDKHYLNGLTQTMDILKPRKEHLGIYPLLHFIPGHPRARSAQRKDGKRHSLVTTPNSDNAQKIMDLAIVTGDLYHIGITAHSYVDTWAHQNFLGTEDEFNGLAGFPESVVPNIGHADAGHKPDIPSLIWTDTRLIEDNEAIDNTLRFMQAAEGLFLKLCKARSPHIKDSQRTQICKSLIEDLQLAIGKSVRSETAASNNREKRISRYRKLSATPEYGGKEIAEYERWLWFNQAVSYKHPRKVPVYLRNSPEGATSFYWTDTLGYSASHWYRFQKAATAHKTIVSHLLAEHGFVLFGDPVADKMETV